MDSKVELKKLLENKELNFEQQFHLLSHFIEVDDEYYNYFIQNSGYSIEDINRQLNKPGSKFFIDFANTPLSLIEKIIDEISLSNFSARSFGKRLEIEMILNTEKYPKGIGYNTIIEQKSLNSKNSFKINEIKRDGFVLRTVNMEKPITHQINIIFEDNILQTIFPGIYAPPFPSNNKYLNEFNEKCKEFWKEHLIIN